jgi:hypothetical protein
MSPKDYYKIAKDAELRQQDAMMKFVQNIDPGKNRVDLMQDGKPIPMSGAALADLMNPNGSTSVEVGGIKPTTVINEVTGRGDGVNAAADAKQKQAAMRAAEFSEKEKDLIGGVGEGKILLTDITNMFNSKGYGKAGDIVKELTAKVPWAGKYAASDNYNYQGLKKVAAEIWLRAATGAAARPEEVKLYAGYLPEESNPPEVAAMKMDNFFSKLYAKLDGRMSAIDLEGKGLEKAGQPELADVKYYVANQARNYIMDAWDQIPPIAGTKKAAKELVSSVNPPAAGQTSTDPYTVGKVYPGEGGTKAKYLGNGQWEEVK